ncbi:MAG: MBL fold metallo-hydrolase [Clostridia bacterium]|nr:MBL fold metallo-hydrolase [Clostridia bacterium]
MNLIVLGCNGPYPAPYGATAGYLVETEKGVVALDMGSGVFARIGKLCPPENIAAVVLTHLHFDHMADMGVFNYYLDLMVKKGKFRGRIPCYVPPIESDIKRLQELYPRFRFIGVKEGAEYPIVGAGCKGQFYRLQHGKTNYGVRITERETNRRLVYSGDTNVCKKLDTLLSGAELWLAGAPFIGDEYDPEGGHLSVEIAREYAEEHCVKTVITHLCPVHTEREYIKACDSEWLSVAKPFQSYNV